MDTAGNLARSKFGAGTSDTQAEVLDPRLEYMKVTVAQSQFLIFKAATLESTPEQAAIQVWYTPAGEVIRLYENGRLHSTAGILQADWRDARSTGAPGWQQVASHGPAQYQRVRDVMPGYHSGLRDQVTVQAVTPPSQVSTLQAMPPHDLQWFEEASELLDQNRVDQTEESAELDPVHTALPVARFAVAPGTERVVYSEQCLSTSICLTLQVWPPSAPRAQSASDSLSP